MLLNFSFENFIIFKLPTFCIYMGYFCHLNRNIAIICFKSFIAVHSHFGLYLFIAYFITKQAHYEKNIISTRSNNIERNIDMVISYINLPINIVLLKSYMPLYLIHRLNSKYISLFILGLCNVCSRLRFCNPK